MKRVWSCRRTFVALVGMTMLLALGLINHADVAGSIATICMALAGANAAEAAVKHTKGQPDATPKS
jgi:hypothetical protein